MAVGRDPRRTDVVVDRHIQALRDRDLNGLLESYSEDARFLSNLVPVAIKGLDALRAFWAQALEVFTPEVLACLDIKQQIIEGDLAYILWSAGPAIPFGSDTFVVRGGKIVAQTGTVQMILPQGS